jgi:hypothetical protein
MKTLLVILFSLGFTSCMHVGMMGVGTGHHAGKMRMMTTQGVFKKEVTTGDVRATANFPNLEYGNEVILTLKLMDAKTLTPISDAQVQFEARVLDPVAPDNYSEPPYHTKQVPESHESGVYTTAYGTVQPGDHRLMFHITAIGGDELDPEIVLETTRVLSSDSREHHGGMMDGTNTTTAMIIGGAAMGVVMIAMLVGGHGMF